MTATTTALAARVVRDWESEQRTALNTVGTPSLTVARGLMVTLTRMDVPALREWAWLTGTWEGYYRGDLRGYTVADLDGQELGVILVRGTIVHAEWLNPATGDHEFAGQVRRLNIAANYIVDRHDGVARAAGRPRPYIHERDALEAFLAPMVAAAQKAAEPIPYGTRVVYNGSLADHRGDVFIVQPHDHVDEAWESDCDCDHRSRVTLVRESGGVCLLHVGRNSFAPAA